MNNYSNNRLRPVASDEMKRKLLQAMANSDGRARDFVGYFSSADFACIPCDANSHHIWAAQLGDVTVLVWERGAKVEQWVAKIQCW